MRQPLIHRLFCSTVAAALFSLAGAASAYSGLVVFGDSISDGGNVAALIGTDPDQVITGNDYIPSAPYASGTFSDGATWVNGLASQLGVVVGPSLAGGSNYAFGGATTSGGLSPSMVVQVGMYLDDVGGIAASDSLFVLAGGGNNARAALEAVLAGEPIVRTAISTAINFARDIGNMVDTLQAAGAVDIVVWNTPNLGLTPAVQSAGPAASFLGQAVSGLMNAALARRLQDEQGVQIFDLYGLLGGAVANPAAFGLLNATDACGALPDCVPQDFLFWDGIHPTTAGQAIIADAMFAAVVPEPGTWALFAAGGLVIALRRRQRG